MRNKKLEGSGRVRGDYSIRTCIKLPRVSVLHWGQFISFMPSWMTLYDLSGDNDKFAKHYHQHQSIIPFLFCFLQLQNNVCSLSTGSRVFYKPTNVQDNDNKQILLNTFIYINKIMVTPKPILLHKTKKKKVRYWIIECSRDDIKAWKTNLPLILSRFSYGFT